MKEYCKSVRENNQMGPLLRILTFAAPTIAPLRASLLAMLVSSSVLWPCRGIAGFNDPLMIGQISRRIDLEKVVMERAKGGPGSACASDTCCLYKAELFLNFFQIFQAVNPIPKIL